MKISKLACSILIVLILTSAFCTGGFSKYVTTKLVDPAVTVKLDMSYPWVDYGNTTGSLNQSGSTFTLNSFATNNFVNYTAKQGSQFYDKMNVPIRNLEAGCWYTLTFFENVTPAKGTKTMFNGDRGVYGCTVKTTKTEQFIWQQMVTFNVSCTTSAWTSCEGDFDNKYTNTTAENPVTITFYVPEDAPVNDSDGAPMMYWVWDMSKIYDDTTKDFWMQNFRIQKITPPKDIPFVDYTTATYYNFKMNTSEKEPWGCKGYATYKTFSNYTDMEFHAVGKDGASNQYGKLNLPVKNLEEGKSYAIDYHLFWKNMTLRTKGDFGYIFDSAEHNESKETLVSKTGFSSMKNSNDQDLTAVFTANCSTMYWVWDYSSVNYSSKTGVFNYTNTSLRQIIPIGMPSNLMKLENTVKMKVTSDEGTPTIGYRYVANVSEDCTVTITPDEGAEIPKVLSVEVYTDESDDPVIYPINTSGSGLPAGFAISGNGTGFDLTIPSTVMAENVEQITILDGSYIDFLNTKFFGFNNTASTVAFADGSGLDFVGVFTNLYEKLDIPMKNLTAGKTYLLDFTFKSNISTNTGDNNNTGYMIGSLYDNTSAEGRLTLGTSGMSNVTKIVKLNKTNSNTTSEKAAFTANCSTMYWVWEYSGLGNANTSTNVSGSVYQVIPIGSQSSVIKLAENDNTFKLPVIGDEITNTTKSVAKLNKDAVVTLLPAGTGIPSVFNVNVYKDGVTDPTTYSIAKSGIGLPTGFDVTENGTGLDLTIPASVMTDDVIDIEITGGTYIDFLNQLTYGFSTATHSYADYVDNTQISFVSFYSADREKINVPIKELVPGRSYLLNYTLRSNTTRSTNGGADLAYMFAEDPYDNVTKDGVLTNANSSYADVSTKVEYATANKDVVNSAVITATNGTMYWVWEYSGLGNANATTNLTVNYIKPCVLVTSNVTNSTAKGTDSSGKEVKGSNFGENYKVTLTKIKGKSVTLPESVMVEIVHESGPTDKVTIDANTTSGGLTYTIVNASTATVTIDGSVMTEDVISVNVKDVPTLMESVANSVRSVLPF